MSQSSYSPSVSRKAGRVLVVAIVLTAASFIGSTYVSERAAAGIHADAQAIIDNSSPSVAHLSSLRTDLRRLEVEVDDFVDRAVAGLPPSDGGRAAITTTIDRLFGEWDAYIRLPAFPGESDSWARTAEALRDVRDTSVHLRALVDAGRLMKADALLEDGFKPLVEFADERVSRLRDFDSVQGTRLAREIDATYHRSVRLLLLLHTLSALFALVTALLAARVVHQNVDLLESRAAELEQFAGRVAHDILGSIAAATLSVEVARTHPVQPETSRWLERSKKSLAQVSQIVRSLLSFARAGARPDPGAWVDVGEVVERVVELIRPEAAAKLVELSVEPFQPVAAACGDGILISVLSNLLGNAIKFTHESAIRRVTVRLSHRVDRVRIEVEDTGSGFPAEAGAMIFQPLVRATRPDVPGIGLGLATVRRLVEAHGGAVGAASELGRGARFWVELPRATPSSTTAASA
jgi:signal transduction histidine kinase